MNSQKRETDLHRAAKKRRVEQIREQLYDKQSDPNALNMHGKTAAFMYFINLLTKANRYGSDNCLTSDEIDCFTELLWFTYDTQRSVDNERKEIFDMLDYCFQFSDVPLRKLYMEIVNVFFTNTHQRRYFIDKILNANLPSDYCLIAAMFDMNGLLKDLNFVTLRSNFLSELFALFLNDESFFEEYLAEVMSTGSWPFNVRDQSRAFCRQLPIHHPVASVFDFVKYLIRYDIDFVQFLKQCIIHLPSDQSHQLTSDAFVPLSKFVNPPIELSQIMRQGYATLLSCYNFNETESVMDDFHDFIAMESNSFQVVSLKNLARMAVRKWHFQEYSHYKALSLLYSVDIPTTLRSFLCYNYCNLKF